jgi:small subunit ribosomal protein S14
MAKTSSIVKDAKRRAAAELGKYPKVRLKNRCVVCGRPRGFYRQFGLCRLHFRQYAHQGLLPGVLKSSW